MATEEVGVDAMGRAAVALNNGKDGECQGEPPKHASTLHVLADNSGVEITPGLETLDGTKADIDPNIAGTGYKWTDRDLTMKVVSATGGELSLVFASAGATLFSVKCLAAGELGSCTKE
jgi:hypothetical protein